MSKKIQDMLNVLISKYYCNCEEGRHGKVGADVREFKSAILSVFKEMVLDSMPKLRYPEKVAKEGWSYAEQVGRNQGIEDYKANLLKEIDEV